MSGAASSRLNLNIKQETDLSHTKKKATDRQATNKHGRRPHTQTHELRMSNSANSE